MLNLNKLVDAVFVKTSNWTKGEGEKIFNKGLVSSVTSKNINNFYNIYGRVKNENNSKEYYTHLKINLIKGSLEESKCSCESFMENSKYDKTFLCPHLTATTCKFYSLACKTLQKSKDSNTKENYKSGDLILKKLIDRRHIDNKVKIDIKLSYINNPSLDYYEAELRVGKKNTVLLKSLESFIDKKNKGEDILFANEFIYKPEINYLSREDEKLVDFIEEYININKEFLKNSSSVQFPIVNGRNLRILPNNLRGFLKTISGKTITFKYDYIEYTPKILEKDLPISFTIKNGEEGFILTTKKKFPLPLNKNKNVYFYDGNIYLPRKDQIEVYNPFYDKLKEYNEIIFKKDVKTFKELVSVLKIISNDINFHESIQKYTSELLTPKFYLNKDNDKITCDVKLKYGDEVIDIIKDKNKSTLVDRDIKKEGIIENQLSKLKFIKRHDEFVFIGSDEDIYRFLKDGIKKLLSLGEVHREKEFQDLKLYDSSFIESEIYEDNGNITLNYKFGNVDLGDYSNMFKAFNENKSFFKTKNNIFIDFKDYKVGEFLNLIQCISERFTESNNIQVDNNKAYYSDEIIRKNQLNFIKGKDILENISSKITEVKNMEYKEPEGLNGTLREYQLIGYRWMKTLFHMGFGGILADEMGLGKTIQTISFILSENNSKSLIVAPTSLIYNWKNEFEKFAPSLNIGIVHGSVEERFKVIENRQEYDVLLTTYGTLRNDFDLYKNIIFDFCIIDEGQNIKNPQSQITEKMKNIKAKTKFVLTGTPIENNLMELWSIFDFTMPGYLYKKDVFQSKFIINYDHNIEDLKTLIRPFILRREKRDVLKDLPDKIEKKFLVEMNKSQMEIYKSYMKEIKEKLKNNKGDKITVFSYLTKLRQLCLDPKLLIENYSGGSSKVEVAMDMVNEGIHGGKKILLFSQFTSVLKNISKVLDGNDIKYMYLDGSTKASERVRLVDEFNESESIKVFLISLKAGGTGLNLTSANLVIHFDPWWNPAIEDQATDRAHRIGQKNIVEVIKLVSKGTIEEKIITLQGDKKELINSVMNGELKDGKVLTTLSNDELMELFN